MLLFYSIGIRLYHLAACMAAMFNAKAKLFCEGRKGVFEKLEKIFADDTSPRIWFHCSSYGEFEQGRPVLQQLKTQYPGYKIVLTFFSPSGYAQGVKEKAADCVLYLPADTAAHAKKWISVLKPSLAVFVKYDFWFHYMNELSNKNIPFVYVSSIFRENQFFFKPWGKSFLAILKKASAFYVQNSSSAELLKQHGIQQVMVTGDTRFDRVAQLPEIKFSDEVIEKFIQGDVPLIVAGSTWPGDHQLLAAYLNRRSDIKMIIIPHEIDEKSIASFTSLCNKKYLKYSDAEKHNIGEGQVLIVNRIGMLSKIYRYANVCYIGGGFGKGIHNILEGAVYGKPVVFGPVYEKFAEAVNLIDKGGAFAVADEAQLQNILNRLLDQKHESEHAGAISRVFVAENAGATQAVMNQLGKYLS
ncbi:MAG: 3-deoxy-D-manno-octulosonic acid transferase [Bacteroidetes bacterium]|nr:3-deoxy-D-manno-octulosonic acid transferase [Bacteroidota bacterium]